MTGAFGRVCVLICLFLMLFAGSGCGSIRDGAQACAGASALPSNSLQDWATYADYLVEWQATTEGRIPPTPEESTAGEGTITRVVRVESPQVLWRRPSAPDHLTVPQYLDVASGGWEFHGKKERPFEGVAPRLEVGRNYLAVLSFTDLSAMSTRPDRPEWIALDYFALDERQLVARTTGPCRSAQLEGAIAGKSAGEVAASLAVTPVHAAAKRYLDLDPVIRFQRAATDESATSSYTPGPGPGEKE